MKKPWLLTISDKYYPSGGDTDWIGFYETEEEAIEMSKKIKTEDESGVIYIIRLILIKINL